jgi:hypothetical protein
MSLADYVLAHTERGTCTCGKCFDAPENPKEKQPTGHTVNLTFFKVAAKGVGESSKDEFLSLVQLEYPKWLDGKEHNYLEVGADMGDQGIGLMTIGLGHLLGVWTALSPDTMIPSLPEDLKQQMAGRGYVSLKYENI